MRKEASINVVLINALNFIKNLLEANLGLYTFILKYELKSHQAVQIHPQEEPSASSAQTRKRCLCDCFFSGKNLTLEKLKLIIFCQMYK
jgi:hypothetical protein